MWLLVWVLLVSFLFVKDTKSTHTNSHINKDLGKRVRRASVKIGMCKKTSKKSFFFGVFPRFSFLVGRARPFF